LQIKHIPDSSVPILANSACCRNWYTGNAFCVYTINNKKMKEWLMIAGAIVLFSTTACSPQVVPTRPHDVVYSRSVSPGPGYVWISGDWVWSRGNYRWREGRWERRRAGRSWHEGYWEKLNNGYRWHRGRW
jgi:hypothetical protein